MADADAGRGSVDSEAIAIDACVASAEETARRRLKAISQASGVAASVSDLRPAPRPDHIGGGVAGGGLLTHPPLPPVNKSQQLVTLCASATSSAPLKSPHGDLNLRTP